MVTRRTKAEIEAGFPHELKAKGVDFMQWVEEQRAEAKPNGRPKPQLPLMGVVRRAKEEIEAGFPIEVKRTGVTFDQWKEEQAKLVAEVEKQKKTKKVLIEAPPEPKQAPKTKVEYVKHVEKVIVETNNNRKELKEIIQETFDKCVWEWKHVPMDNKFKVSTMTSLGKQGWKFAFIFDPKMVSENSKKVQQMCFQRPRQK
ncbi:MAG: hypothetical protein H8D23_20280 [Candidatus Brocadiales bacterium]|nr:hypothetical protein [Candidatus Brocadiales bacterium]